MVSFKSESSADVTDVSSLFDEDNFRSPLVEATVVDDVEGSSFVWQELKKKQIWV